MYVCMCVCICKCIYIDIKKKKTKFLIHCISTTTTGSLVLTKGLIRFVD